MSFPCRKHAGWGQQNRASKRGTRNKIVSPWGGEVQEFVEELIEEDRGEGEDLFGKRGVAVVEDLPGGLVVFVAVFAEGVKPEVVGGGFGEEVGAGREGFDLVELILDEAVGGFDIGLPGVGGGRDGWRQQAGDGLDGLGEGAVLAGRHTADERTAVIGLEAAADQVHAAVLEVLEQEAGKEGRASQGAFLGVAEEVQATHDLAGGVLDPGQTEAANRGPQLRDIVEVLSTLFYKYTNVHLC